MTYQGAINELKSLENNESMPDWFKPTLKKVRETMEMDGRENIDGEWILQPSNKEQGERDFIWWKCSKCGQVIYSETEKDREEFHAFCGRCGADMRGEG